MAHVPLDKHPETEAILQEDIKLFIDEGNQCTLLQRRAESIAALAAYYKRYISNSF